MASVAYNRQVFKAMKKSFPKGTVISAHQLRVEAPISNNANTYELKILEDTQAGIKTEIRLNKNDMMYVTGIGLALYNRKAINDPSASTETIEPLQTYPNQTYFAASVLHVPGHLEVFYKGDLSLKIGNTVFIPKLSTDKFKYVPQTQQSAATNKSQYTNDDLIKELASHYRIKGTDQIEFNLNVKTIAGLLAAADTTTSPNTENRVVLLLDGFLVKNGANLPEVEVEG